MFWMSLPQSLKDGLQLTMVQADWLRQHSATGCVWELTRKLLKALQKQKELLNLIVLNC